MVLERILSVETFRNVTTKFNEKRKSEKLQLFWLPPPQRIWSSRYLCTYYTYYVFSYLLWLIVFDIYLRDSKRVEPREKLVCYTDIAPHRFLNNTNCKNQSLERLVMSLSVSHTTKNKGTSIKKWETTTRPIIRPKNRLHFTLGKTSSRWTGSASNMHNAKESEHA